MKRVAMTYTMDFEDDVPDDDAFSSAVEVMSQDRHWPNDDQIAIRRVAQDAPIVSMDQLESGYDMLLDEFLRIKACPDVTPEIVGLCERAAKRIKQRVPLIEQRDDLARKLRKALQTIDELNEAAIESGDMP